MSSQPPVANAQATRRPRRSEDPGCHARLADEPLARRRGERELGREHLDGDITIELDFAREIDDAHATPAEFALDRVLTGQGGLKIEEVGRGMRHVTASRPPWALDLM